LGDWGIGVIEGDIRVIGAIRVIGNKGYKPRVTRVMGMGIPFRIRNSAFDVRAFADSTIHIAHRADHNPSGKLRPAAPILQNHQL
jgi:hypothetical protein